MIQNDCYDERYGADCDMQYLTSSTYKETCLSFGQTEEEISNKIQTAIEIYEQNHGIKGR